MSHIPTPRHFCDPGLPQVPFAEVYPFLLEKTETERFVTRQPLTAKPPAYWH